MAHAFELAHAMECMYLCLAQYDLNHVYYIADVVCSLTLHPVWLG